MATCPSDMLFVAASILLVVLTPHVGSAVAPRCLLPQDAGDCDNYTMSYFFDKFHWTCRMFWYGGCGGNANRFPSMLMCQWACHEGFRAAAATTIATTTTTTTPRPFARWEVTTWDPDKTVDACDMPASRGPCMKYKVRWFYNQTSQQCSRFWYGGCYGNANNFVDQISCSNRCPRKGESETVELKSEYLSPFVMCLQMRVDALKGIYNLYVYATWHDFAYVGVYFLVL